MATFSSSSSGDGGGGGGGGSGINLGMKIPNIMDVLCTEQCIRHTSLYLY